MINKKILAASIAATFAFNANALVSLNTSSTALKYASEAIANGGVITTIAANNFTVKAGLNLPVIAGGVPFYVRVELGNAKFATNAVAAGALTTAAAGTTAITLAGGGVIADSYVVFGYANDTATASAALFTFDFSNGAATNLTVTDKTKPVTVTYKLYQNADSLAALNGTGTAVVTTALDAITFVTGQDVAGSFTAVSNTALVSKQFKEFKLTAGTAAGKTANLGQIDLLVKTGVLASDDSLQVVEADVYTTPTTTATVTGDFSFGKTWFIDNNVACTTTPGTGTTLTVAADMKTASVPSTAFTSAQHLCVTVDGTTVVPRVSTAYSIALASNTGVSGSLGTITYDTTSISIPYVTTFSDYNQRVYIRNASSVDAPYTTTFTTEEGTTSTAGTAATGIVKAKTVLSIKASDLVTFVGKTRGAASIEIEATDTNVQATTQTVNLSDGSTDTVILAVKGS
jgi:hypothetical protein